MATFTIFFCGTGSNSKDVTNPKYHQGELVSTLASNHLGSEFVDWIIVDGPGSGNLREDEKWRFGGNYKDNSGKTGGHGWEENVDHAIAILDGSDPHYLNEHKKSHYIETEHVKLQGVTISSTFGKDKPMLVPKATARVAPQYTQRGEILLNRRAISHVNVIGWSRGGITCHMFANKLKQHPVLGNLPVRIFACDPVPGYGMFTPAKHRIDLTGTNVTDYVGIYSEDERSRFFSPVKPLLPSGCNTYITTMPGRHATLVGNSSLNGSDGAGADGINGVTGPGRITRHCAEVWLTHWGTELKNRLNMSGIECIKLYDEMIGQQDIFLKMHKESTIKKFRLSFTQRSRSVFTGNGTCVNFESAFSDNRPPGFLSLHHRDMFQLIYPDIHRFVFERKMELPRMEMPPTMARTLLDNFPNLCDLWRGIGLLPK